MVQTVRESFCVVIILVQSLPSARYSIDAGCVSFAFRSHATWRDETAAIRTAVTYDGLRRRTFSATDARDRVELLDCVVLDLIPRVASQRYRRGCYSQSGWRSG